MKFRSMTFVIAALALSSSMRAAASGIEFDCLIEPAQVVEVRSPVVGLVEQVHVRRGEMIRKGQLLVSIESGVEQSQSETARFRAEAQGALLLAQSKVRAAREKARRYQELYEEEFVSGQARDDAANELKLAEAELKTAEENAQLARLEHRQAVEQLNRRVLRSPFNGVVVDQYLHPGSLVDSGEGKKPIIKIAQTDPLVVRAILPYSIFPQVKPGIRAVVLPEPPFKGEIEARIATVDRVIDLAAGTFGVRVELDNAKRQLPAGIRCRLRMPGVGSATP